MPYEKGKIDGDVFVYDWIRYIFNITMCIWSANNLAIVSEFYAFQEDRHILHIMQFSITAQHLHYEHLKEILQQNNISCTIETVKKNQFIEKSDTKHSDINTFDFGKINVNENHIQIDTKFVNANKKL